MTDLVMPRRKTLKTSLAKHWRGKMNGRYMVISPDTLEAMRRAGHAAKLEVRIEKLETALRAIIVHCEVPAPPNAEALKMFARKALEGKDD